MSASKTQLPLGATYHRLRANEFQPSPTWIGGPANASAIRSAITSLIESEFIHRRGRALPLAQRYTDLFGAGGQADFHWLTVESRAVCGLVTRRYRIQAGEREWNGVLLGLLHTVPDLQGKGFAPALFKCTEAAEQADGRDFIWFWSSQSDYFSRLGWTLADPGVLAEGPARVVVRPATDANIRVEGRSPANLSTSMLSTLQAIADSRQLHGQPHHLRDYRRVPFPFDSVLLLTASRCDEVVGYTLLGLQPDWVTVLEWCSDPVSWGPLWQQINTLAPKVRINTWKDSELHQWLRDDANLQWQDKPLGMVMPLRPDFDPAQMWRWYLPYFDRF